MRRAILSMAFALSACAGELDEPARFFDASLLYTCDPDINVERDILAQHCGSCHGGLESESGLNLVSQGVGERLYGVASTTCEGEVLIDLDNRMAGFFFEKIESDEPRCGSRMPLGAPSLTSEEIACLRLYLASQHPEEQGP